MKRTAALFAISTLAACASSGPIALGPHTYMIAKNGVNGGFTSTVDLRVDIIREATAFCATNRKVFQIVNFNDIEGAPDRMASSEVHFMCLEPGDADIRRPRL